MDEIMTVREVSQYLKVSKSKIYSWIRRGKIPYIRLERNVRIRRTDLENWLESKLVRGF